MPRRLALSAALLLAACAPRLGDAPRTDTVLALDFLRTLPGEQADYLEFVRRNWMRAREAATEAGFVVRYEVLTRPPTADTWDVVLITEYASPEAYADREALFGRLFERPDLAMRPIDGKGPREMAEFVGDEVSVRRLGR